MMARSRIGRVRRVLFSGLARVKGRKFDPAVLRFAARPFPT